jgi:hypothetical protein
VPNFGTLTSYENGSLLPSVLKTVTVIVLFAMEGTGKDKYINGSKVTDVLLQVGQVNVDLYCPCKQKIRRKLTTEIKFLLYKIVELAMS